MPPSAQPSEAAAASEAPHDSGRRGRDASDATNCVAALLKEGEDLVGVDTRKAIALIEEANRVAYQIAVNDTQVEKRQLPPPSVEEAMRLQEQGIALLASLYANQGDCESLQQLMRSSLPFFSLLAKARTAKLLGMLQQAQPILQQLLQEVKKLDDKLLLVEIHLIESKLQFKVKNYPKARAALTASRTNANAIHCPPLLQGDIDLQAGILAAQDRDYKTAFSYFFEAFDAFSAQDAAHHSQKAPTAAGAAVAAATKCSSTPAGPSKALQALKYMLLSKILQGKDDEVSSLLTGKQCLRYYSMDTSSTCKPAEASTAGGPVGDAATAPASGARRDLEAMRQLALCHKQRSLKKFEEVLDMYARELKGDEVLMHHIDELYENLLEKNLLKLLRPFSRVELAHVAQLIGLPLAKVEEKLSEMILDGKLHGTLDQGVGVLLLFEEQVLPEMHVDALATIKNMAQVVDTLYEKSLQAL
ncbi:putative proteasome PCI domain-containing protein [Neospora caninum Liverpool]|uniref:Putative proteasome PCI domain-containing protein n=1 Tax=Neospora caninum (strain Liverpool) TaxID=572307 RepID=F0VLI3_NEOCL|nr:putative proteasome PCI domain-containing protein [Neospora caninum Liverpool]CBZ54111.1 putative proteasome PCI domain-containing protein [Neospora caninum Liverpool]|eukprot:XP_003884142.1 putative proteasome PCI domain-containing protein [Neospora caninum Liverpool]